MSLFISGFGAPDTGIDYLCGRDPRTEPIEMGLRLALGSARLNNGLNLGAGDACTRAMEELGFRLEDIGEQEWDAGLGDGGIGRLAASIPIPLP